MSGDRMQFRCRGCGCFWDRRYGDKGTFIWSESVGLRPGMDTPGRPGTAPP